MLVSQTACFSRGNGLAAPDAFVLSAGLWHMLHTTDVQLFRHDLAQLRDAAASFLAKAVQVRAACVLCKCPPDPCLMPGTRGVVMQAPPVSYFSISEVYPPKLKTEDKREHLTPARVDAYNRAIANSAILSPDGPFHLIDIHGLTQGALPNYARPLHAHLMHSCIFDINGSSVCTYHGSSTSGMQSCTFDINSNSVCAHQRSSTSGMQHGGNAYKQQCSAPAPGLWALSLRRVRPRVHP